MAKQTEVQKAQRLLANIAKAKGIHPSQVTLRIDCADVYLSINNGLSLRIENDLITVVFKD